MERQVQRENQHLNQAQRQAVDIKNGPVLVVAGAGTGKTRVIVERISKLIELGVDPKNILALTFTEKAASEMLDRVNAGKVGVTLDTTIATFNRFGHELLQMYGNEYGLGSLRLLGDTGQLVFLREHFDEFGLDYFAPVSNPDGQLEMLADYVSLLKQQLVTPKQYQNYADKLPTSDEAEQLDKQKHQELAKFFKIYLNLCRREYVIDYDDQIYLTIEMLEARPNILKSLQERYQYLLIDEFQDTNPMQSKLVDMIAGKRQNVMVVGDDDQSIYGWRGATLANILGFKKRYPKAREITLIENYRSTQSILDRAYTLIKHNNPDRLEVMNKIDKRLRGRTEGKDMLLQHFRNFDSELSWIAEDIKQRLASGQAPGSIAVLARRNHGVLKVHEVLELNDVQHAVAGLDNDIYAKASVRQLIEALKSIADPHDDLALFHTLIGSLFNLDITKLAELTGEAGRTHQPLAEIIQTNGDNSTKQALSQISTWRNEAREQTVGYLAYNILTDSGWKQRLYNSSDKPDIVIEVQALEEFFKTLKEFEKVSSVGSVQQYIVNLPVLRAAGSQFEDVTLDILDDQINVLSVHRAKGLEWQTVYIVDCTEGSFPLSKFGKSLNLPEQLRASQAAADDYIAEERRLMYVAITRAENEVILSYADQHGNGTHRKPSRFLAELGFQPSADIINEEAQTSLELFAPNSTGLSAIEPPRIMKHDGRIFLSVSQIERWLDCPKDFYYRYVLNMPLPPAPQLGYGTLIHGVIEKVHQGRQKGKIPSLQDLIDEIIPNLPQSGYPSKKTRERSHAQAVKTIKNVYDRFLKDELPIETEWPFTLDLTNIPLTIKGKIDAVYQTSEGVEIRDFKTGTSVRTAEQAKTRVASSQQLTLYALAWQQLRGEMPAKLSLDFVETGQIGSIKKKPKSLETLEKKLEIMVEQLQAGHYPDSLDHKRCMHPID